MNRWVRAAAWAAAASLACGAYAAIENHEPSRFDRLVVHDPSSRLGIVAEAPEAVPGLDALRAGWAAFRSENGDSWRVFVDRRSGTPLLAEGAGIRWFGAGQAVTASGLEQKARQLVTAHGAAFGISGTELVLDTEATGTTGGGRWVVVFDRVVGGVPVEGEQLILYVNRGNLVSFGASRWGAIPAVQRITYGEPTARELLYAYMGLGPGDAVEELEPARQVLVAAPLAEGDSRTYAGPAGEGVTHLLAWRFTLQVDGEPGTWIGKVDACTGKVVALYDDTMYAGVKGGVYPISNDQNCGDFGCELAGYPAPYVNVTIGRSLTQTSDMGLMACPSKGPKKSSAMLAGRYVTTQDTCGNAAVSGNCTSDLDFGTSSGTDCTSPAGLAGDTHAARSSYYHLNRAKEKARYWLPSNTWLNQQLTNKPNVSGTCNAFWNGTVNFYRSGGGCRNAGEIAGVVTHEYGHGLDQNDGGGYDNPSEGYADVISILNERRSCVGRGFFQSGNCSGYGDACLGCSGIRDMDWDAHASHTAATPANFTLTRCGGGGGPCGREVHCEAYVPAEAIYDLAARDLQTVAGLDADSAWQLAEKLFYTSRQGSGGNAFNCGGGSSDGCASTSWFTKLRNADDDDGNLANGTPHAAAIFAAFDRHRIACGLAADASNQSVSSCPGLAAAANVNVTAGTGQVSLSWDAVPGAARYLVLRNDISCGYSSNVIATVAGTSYTDADLPSGFQLYYRIQAQGDIDACDAPLSACVPASAN